LSEPMTSPRELASAGRMANPSPVTMHTPNENSSTGALTAVSSARGRVDPSHWRISGTAQ